MAKLAAGEPASEAKATLMLSTLFRIEGCTTVALGVARGACCWSRRMARLWWRCASDGEPPPPRLSLVGASRGHQGAKGEERGVW
jgi:hypothetical protein